ncbi:hypothetical protein BAUCODRAFT_38766, partial [Baudoinia panamericana UAMH 10762]
MADHLSVGLLLPSYGTDEMLRPHVRMAQQVHVGDHGDKVFRQHGLLQSVFEKCNIVDLQCMGLRARKMDSI